MASTGGECQPELRCVEATKKMILELSSSCEGSDELKSVKTICEKYKDIKLATTFIVLDGNGALQGVGTTAAEPKFIHECAAVGHIVNLNIWDTKNSTSVAKLLVGKLLERSRNLGCYKCIYDSPPEIARTIENTALRRKDVQMKHYLKLDSSMRSKAQREKFIVRTLDMNDFEQGFLKLLEQLTVVGNVSFNDYKSRLETRRYFNFSQATHDDFDYRSLEGMTTLVVQSVETKRVVATSTLLTLWHSSLGYVGHIEDVVVDHQTRGQGLGRYIMECTLEAAAKRKCNLCILNCNEKNISFYQKCGFEKGYIGFTHYFKQ